MIDQAYGMMSGVPASDIQFRQMTIEDIPAIVSIEREAFTAPWSPETTRALLHRYAALPDPRWRTGRPPNVLLVRGDADLLGANWEGLTRRWPENSLELEVLRLRIRLRESFAPPPDDSR